MSKSTSDLKEILAAGGSVSVDASTKSSNDWKELATIAQSSGATLILRNAGKKGTGDLKAIAETAPGKVIFEF